MASADCRPRVTTIIEINPGSEIASLTPGRNNRVDREILAIEKNNRLIKESAEITASRDSLQAWIDNRQQGYDIQIAGYGVGDKNQQRQQELLRIEEHGYNNQRLQLERDYADKSRGMSDHVFQEKMQALNDALEQEKEIIDRKTSSSILGQETGLVVPPRDSITGWMTLRISVSR